MDYFLEIYGALPRAGPGSAQATRRAWAMLPALPAAARVLDLGCGPGAQTLELLRLSQGPVVALDLLPRMLERTRSAAADAGYEQRLELLEADMRQLQFDPGSFDLIWSEGALYNLGFEAGLRRLRDWLRPGGCVVVSEPVWLQPQPPAPVRAFWEEYPEIDTVENKLDLIRGLGYTSLGQFVLPDAAWQDEYYTPMAARVQQKASEWQGVAEAEAVLDEARAEMAIFERYSAYYGYAFFVMQWPGDPA